MTRLENKILDLVKQANEKWQLFAEKQKILVAVSGGKDSLALLHLMRNMDIDVQAVHIRLSNKFEPDFIEQNKLQDTIKVVDTDILNEVADHKNPCFSCSRKRRRIILETADKSNIKTVAMGHHKNDVIETLLMNMLYSREISTLNPQQTLFKGRFFVIRPLYLVPEKLLHSLSLEKKWHITKPVCKEESNSKRNYIKSVVNQWQQDHPGIDVTDNLFSSLKAIKKDFLPF